MGEHICADRMVILYETRYTKLLGFGEKMSKVKNIGFIKSLKKISHRFSSLDRNTKLAVSLLAVLLLVGSWAFFFSKRNTSVTAPLLSNQASSSDVSADSPALKATLSYLEGVVEQKNDRGEWTTASQDVQFSNGMCIRTSGASSRAVVSFEDGSEIRLDASTEVSFDRLTQNQITIRQESGYAYHRVTGSSSRKYNVVTDNAQYESLGTAFRTIASGDEEAIEVFQSTVSETTSNKSAGEGQKLIAKSNAQPEKSGSIEQLDIENIKKDPFIIWNRERDQKSDTFKNNLGFLKDFDGPTIEISEPAENESVEVEEGATTGKINIKGKTEPKSTLSVQSKSITGSSPVTITINDDGSFETGEIQGVIGTSLFEFTAKDRLGNKTVKTVTYVFKRQVEVQEQGITLTIDKSDKKRTVTLSWSLVGISTPDGVHVLRTEDGLKPTETDLYKTITSKTTSTLTISYDDLDSTKTYNFVVCRYLEDQDSCDEFSNRASISLSE